MRVCMHMHWSLGLALLPLLCLVGAPAGYPATQSFPTAASLGPHQRGGARSGARAPEIQEHLVEGNCSFVDLVQQRVAAREARWAGGRCNLVLPPGLWMWDWRIMSPWLKRVEDEAAEFPLSPPPGSELHVRGLGNTSQPSRLEGQWDIPPACSGSFFGVEMCLRTRHLDARELLLLNSGPWNFDQCQLRASGCQAVRCERQAQVSIRRCFIGGYCITPRAPSVFEDFERASNGVVVTDSASLSLDCCRIENTGFLHGSALKFRGNATGRLRQCVLRKNLVGLHQSNWAHVRAENCVLHEHNVSLFYAEDHPENEATLCLINCSGVSDMIFYDDTEPRNLELHTCNFGPQPEQTFDEYFYETYVNVPLHQQPLEKGKLPYHVVMQEMGYAVDKGDNVVVCLSCGATNDLEDDSSTCLECFNPDAEFVPKYGLTRDLPWRPATEPERGGVHGGDDGGSAMATTNEKNGSAWGWSRGGMSAREREREAWLQRERDREGEGITVEELLPSGLFSRSRRRHVESEYGFVGADDNSMQHGEPRVWMQGGAAVGGSGESMDGSHLGVERRGLRYVDDARQRPGWRVPGHQQQYDSKVVGDMDVSSARALEEEQHSSGVDGGLGLQGGVQEDGEELDALRQSVFDLLPSKEAKDIWLDQQQKRSAREWEGGPSSEGDADSSLDSRTGLSSIPTLRQVKARAKAGGHDQVGILGKSVRKGVGPSCSKILTFQ